jgi:chromosome segregation ATPase
VVGRKRRKEKLERDLRAVKKELRDGSARLKALKARLEEQKVDVEALERTGLTATFHAALGSREGGSDVERQELLSAQLLYRQTNHQVEALKQEKESLRAQLDELEDRFFHVSEQMATQRFAEEARLKALLDARVKEISEAISAAKDVIPDLEQLIASLEEAEDWGTLDVLGGGLVSTAVKHSRIDDARSSIDSIQAKMSRFTRELADVREHAELKIDVGEFESFADYFFDGLIADWVVQSKILASLERSKKAREAITQAVKELEALKKRLQDRAQPPCL